jgi:hypothetical protein
VVLNCVKKRTCFGCYFVEIEVLIYNMLIIKFLNFALKHYAVCNSIIFVFDINSKI